MLCGEGGTVVDRMNLVCDTEAIAIVGTAAVVVAAAVVVVVVVVVVIAAAVVVSGHDGPGTRRRGHAR